MLAEPVERVLWSPGANWPQWCLIQCPVFEVFFGGARGGGKTDGMLGEWMAHADRYGDKAAGLMIRRTRTELIDTIERSRAIYSPLKWTYQEQEKMWLCSRLISSVARILARTCSGCQLAPSGGRLRAGMVSS